MSPRGRRLTGILGLLVILLFVGRWTATLLADRWWAGQFSPAAAAFLTQWHLLRFTLDFAGCAVASAWFIGHLLLVYRAVGTVQVRRNVANLEFREALTPRALLTIVVVSGVLLGLLVGIGASGWWRDVTLAWNGVSYGINDPLLGRDLGVYVAQLPIWRAAHGFFVLLVLLALTGVAALYMLVGAIRWIERRPAINQHARAHLGWLLAALALSLAWGYILEPYELLMRPAELLDVPTWRATMMASFVLAGIALAAGALSGIWAARARHALVVSAWIMVALASLVGHWLLPAFLSGAGEPAADPTAVEQLSRVAYSLDGLREEELSPAGQATPPAVPSLWNPVAVTELFKGDSSRLLSLNPAILSPDTRPRPVWLILRARPPGEFLASAVADHRVSTAGEALFYRLTDTLPRSAPIQVMDLDSEVLAPEAQTYRFIHARDRGIGVENWLKRAALAWALQGGDLLAEVPEGARIDWHLSPEERVERLAPFADWSAPSAAVIGGRLIWLLDGYMASSTFPLTGRVTWRNRRVSSVRASFLATVNAETGSTHIYLQENPDPAAQIWATLADGVVEPASAIPEDVLQAWVYPADLFRIQAQQLERDPWKAGNLSRRPGQTGGEPMSPQIGWASDTSRPLLVSGFEQLSHRRLAALLVGSRVHGRPQLSLVRMDSAYALPLPGALQDRWTNFPSFDAISDSIREDGGTLEAGPVRVALSPGGPVAYQAYFALRPSGGTVLAWMSVAAPNRLGAGRTLKEAWSNLLGATVPAPPGPAQTGRLDEARRWMLHADSALKAGDWSEFGRAWSSLRNVLGVPLDSARF